MCELKHTYPLNHQPCKLYFFIFRLPCSSGGRKFNLKRQKGVRKQNKIVFESFGIKHRASLGFQGFGFYHSVCHTISQKNKIARHVVSSWWEHPKLLFQSKDPRGSPCCNLVASSWGPLAPAHPCQPQHPRKPYQPSSLPLPLPLISGCLRWRLWAFIFRCTISGWCIHLQLER